MVAYKEDFSIGSLVRIIDIHKLDLFQKTWKFHHKLLPEQLKYAGKVAEVVNVSFYHGGDVLYELKDIPGIWHESCLKPLI